jgi:hypothetical protein
MFHLAARHTASPTLTTAALLFAFGFAVVLLFVFLGVTPQDSL